MDVVRLPIEKWKEYRDLRLRALKEDPEAFSASYATGQAQPDEFWKKRLADSQEGEWSWLLFATEDDRLIGMIGAFVEDEIPDTATIVSVYVPKEERGRGISTKLMAKMLRVLSETARFKKAQLMVNVNQLPAIQLYRKFGFREVGRQPATTGEGQPVEQMVMERPLPAGELIAAP
jgi:ribosomal protein S18 acetylase RimI-like enzyme